MSSIFGNVRAHMAVFTRLFELRNFSKPSKWYNILDGQQCLIISTVCWLIKWDCRWMLFWAENFTT